MSNGDKERVTRIKRIFQNDDKDSDTWIDVERIEELWVETGKGADWQERHYTFDWDDFDNNDQQNSKKKISNPDDPDTFVEVPIRSGATLVMRGARYQQYIHTFLNDETNKSRRTHSRKIYHYDIDADRLKDGQPPSRPFEYKSARKDKDEDQHVEVEILEDYISSSRAGRDIHGRSGFTRPHGAPTPGHWQQRIWHFEGSSLLDDDQGALTHINNPDAGPKIDPPWRLDPLQNIVNVNWGGLAVIFGPEAQPAPAFKKT
jgi:hypothetical protein